MATGQGGPFARVAENPQFRRNSAGAVGLETGRIVDFDPKGGVMTGRAFSAEESV